MKIKKELIILPAVILILVLVLVLSNPDKNIKYKVPLIDSIPEDSIDKIELGALTMVKDKALGIWRLSPQNYPVAPMDAQGMINAVKSMKLDNLISEKKAYNRYQLTDNTKLSITVFSNGKSVLKLDIGKYSDQGDHTFIMIDQNPNVYSIKGNIRENFEKEVDDLRDKVVLSFDKQSITEVIFNLDDQNVTAYKDTVPVSESDASAGTKDVWKIKGDETPVKEKVMQDLLNEFSNLSCDSFLSESNQKDFSTPAGRVTFKGGDREYSVSMLERQSDNKHPAISSSSDYQFYIMSWQGSRALKSKADLIEE